MILQQSAIGDIVSSEAGEVPGERDISPDPWEEATAVPTDSIVNNQPNTSSLEISTAEQDSDENTRVVYKIPDWLKGLDVHNYQSCKLNQQAEISSQELHC